MDVLRGFGILLLCQSAGELLARGLGLPLPGPVIGMLILLLALNLPAVREPVSAPDIVRITRAGVPLTPLAEQWSDLLLFVPVGVGVIAHLGLVAQHGWQLMGVIVASTALGLGVTAWVLNRMWRPAEQPPLQE